MEELTDEIRSLIEQIVSLHGEGGVCPTKHDWETIFRCAADKPVNMLNLLKFKQSVQTLEGSSTGFAAYGNYSAGVSGAFDRVGGKLLYFGKVNHIFGTVAETEWHAAILTRYPSPQAVADFWLDEEFIAAHTHRTSGVEASRVLVMSALRSVRPEASL